MYRSAELWSVLDDALSGKLFSFPPFVANRQENYFLSPRSLRTDRKIIFFPPVRQEQPGKSIFCLFFITDSRKIYFPVSFLSATAGKFTFPSLFRLRPTGRLFSRLSFISDRRDFLDSLQLSIYQTCFVNN
jgi:hypothetical protein